MLSLNCQERTDTCDLLGSIRPGENGTFKWFDGVVVTAMRSGRPVLLDEISLASDSVIYKTFNFVVLINLIVLILFYRMNIFTFPLITACKISLSLL